jgi:monoamine oxidase
MKVIIIGAGASGLMAAKELAKKKVEVVLLEALDRIGGRIHTITPKGFTGYVEAGAEFIHGKLPLTCSLLKEAGLGYAPVEGEMYRAKDGEIRDDFGEGSAWKEFHKAMNDQKQDCTIKQLLETRFSSPEYENLRQEVRSRAQGLDLADISRLSVVSIREEWQSQETQYRPIGGYSLLMEYLYRQAATSGLFEFHLAQKAIEIIWSDGIVTVKTPDKVFSGNSIIVTIPLGNLLKSDITFTPDIPETRALFEEIGFGSVIKIALEFAHPFWMPSFPDMGFLFSEDGFTFWTQLPQETPLLIAWIGNDFTAGYEDTSDDELIFKALQKLQDAFQSINIHDLYRAGAVFRYGEQSFSRGGYSWLTPQSKHAIDIINKGVNETIWFAGEAFHPDSGVGLVEAALQSGKEIAKRIQ